MSDRHDRHGNHDEGRDCGKDERGGGDTRFLDLEISKVIYGEAEGVTREAFRDLLKDAAKERMRERYGDRIDALAQLVVDELLDDLEANLAVEDLIAQRAERSKEVAEMTRAILRDGDGDDD